MTTHRYPRRGLVRLGGAAALLVLLGGCGDSGGGEGSSTGGSNRPAGAEVVMELVAFKPADLEVKAGTTVTWQNRDAGAHTVTSGTVEQAGGTVTTEPDGSFASSELPKGQKFRHVFKTPGTYSYFCSLHPATMRGEVRVA